MPGPRCWRTSGRGPTRPQVPDRGLASILGGLVVGGDQGGELLGALGGLDHGGKPGAALAW